MKAPGLTDFEAVVAYQAELATEALARQLAGCREVESIEPFGSASTGMSSSVTLDLRSLGNPNAYDIDILVKLSDTEFVRSQNLSDLLSPIGYGKGLVHQLKRWGRIFEITIFKRHFEEDGLHYVVELHFVEKSFVSTTLHWKKLFADSEFETLAALRRLAVERADLELFQFSKNAFANEARWRMLACLACQHMKLDIKLVPSLRIVGIRYLEDLVTDFLNGTPLPIDSCRSWDDLIGQFSQDLEVIAILSKLRVPEWVLELEAEWQRRFFARIRESNLT